MLMVSMENYIVDSVIIWFRRKCELGGIFSYLVNNRASARPASFCSFHLIIMNSEAKLLNKKIS